ncbi:MAG: hypothetical protein M0D57_01230 [Sphingobacteriales bacterium JAD_PAG50586_3]|nr:MAG: hypothetical protein M0D57_01230 [Sphingobacteriales bacterium JAD_PAG50586_3]
MKKTISIVIILSIFLFACKKDTDIRDKYVGHYVGLAVPSGWYNVPNGDGQYAELDLSKNELIDNVISVKCKTNPPIVGSTNFSTNSFGTYDTNLYDEIEDNRLYVSDKGILYKKGMFYEDLYYTKFYRFVEPDSIYCLVYFYNGPTSPTEFFVKAKKNDTVMKPLI